MAPGLVLALSLERLKRLCELVWIRFRPLLDIGSCLILLGTLDTAPVDFLLGI